MKIFKTLFLILSLVVCILAYQSSDVNAEVIAYDTDGQFLGIHMNFDSLSSGRADIYIPSMNLTARISLGNGDAAIHNIFFTTPNCTGTPYVTAIHSYIIFKNGERYYIGEKTVPINTQMRIRSYFFSDGSCRSGSWSSTDLVPVQEFDIEQLPITLPVALPLNFGHEPAHPGKWNK